MHSDYKSFHVTEQLQLKHKLFNVYIFCVHLK